MLSFAEEIMLLALDENSGLLRPLPERSMDFTLAGALLLELAFQKKLDADLKYLYLGDLGAHGDPALMEAIAALPRGKSGIPLAEALRSIASCGAKLKRRTLASLVRKRIIRPKRLTVFFFVRRRAYAVEDMKTLESLRGRIRKIVLDPDEIPSPREAVLVALMSACALEGTIFSAAELDVYCGRIDEISKMDLIASSVFGCVLEIRSAIVSAMAVQGI